MAEFEAERQIPAQAEAVFDVVSDPQRLPQWLPTVSTAESTATDDVRVEGEAHGSGYTDEGFWRPRRDQLRVEWGSLSRGGEPAEYAGWLQVEHADEGCSVVVHLSFTGSQDDAHTGGGSEEETQRGLEEALQQLEGLVTR